MTRGVKKATFFLLIFFFPFSAWGTDSESVFNKSTPALIQSNPLNVSCLEVELKGIPDSERPWALKAIADEKIESLRKVSQDILQFRDISTQTIAEEKKKEEEEKNDQKLQEKFENIFRKFLDFRVELASCASFNFQESSYGDSLFAQAYYDFTELFIQFVKEELFPRDWQYLNFDELNKNKGSDSFNNSP